ncbi:MAG TPA: hypothetical protein VHB77_06090 [Planctomycetaceae bacterium]|nr:hypothetical protein [Planctomycetaceae bacterium]
MRCLSRFIASRVFVCAAVVLMLAGCGPRVLEPRGDAQSARAALEEGLSAWKSGLPADDFSEPPVIVNDPDWKAARSLRAFEITEEPRLQGTHWRVFAHITVRGEGQADVSERVCYAVTLGHPVSIVRGDELD